MTKLSDVQRDIIRAGGCQGNHVKWQVQWVFRGRPVGVQVKGLIKRGLLEWNSYTGYSSAWLTDAGRAVQAQIEKEENV